MKFLHNMFDRMEPSFTKGGKHEKYYAIFEMFDTFLRQPSSTTYASSHVRDGIDLKRIMITGMALYVPSDVLGYVQHRSSSANCDRSAWLAA
ncbi:Na(+)-translocating NADH-quinone reductase subunit B [Streptococcus pneumoniae]|nr:Na(+)-translocating NADH-quinone reductase subunit B [Streptococcus pneumoniae]